MKLHDDVKSAIRASVVGLGLIVAVCVLIGAMRSQWPGTEMTWPMTDDVAGMVASDDTEAGASSDTDTTAPLRVGYLPRFGAVKARRNDDPFAQR